MSINFHRIKSIELTPIDTQPTAGRFSGPFASRDLVLHCADGVTHRIGLYADDSAGLVIANSEAIAAAYIQGRDDERNGVTRPQ